MGRRRTRRFLQPRKWRDIRSGICTAACFSADEAEKLLHTTSNLFRSRRRELCVQSLAEVPANRFCNSKTPPRTKEGAHWHAACTEVVIRLQSTLLHASTPAVGQVSCAFGCRDLRIMHSKLARNRSEAWLLIGSNCGTEIRKRMKAPQGRSECHGF